MRGIAVPGQEGEERWYGTVAVDVIVYGMPLNAATILRFETATQRVSMIDVTIADGFRKWALAAVVRETVYAGWVCRVVLLCFALPLLCFATL